MKDKKLCALSESPLTPDEIGSGVLVSARVRVLVDVIGLLVQEAQEADKDMGNPGANEWDIAREKLRAHGEPLLGTPHARMVRAVDALQALVEGS